MLIYKGAKLQSEIPDAMFYGKRPTTKCFLLSVHSLQKTPSLGEVSRLFHFQVRLEEY